MTLESLRARAEERLSAFRLYVDDTTQEDVQLIADFLNFLDARKAQGANPLHEEVSVWRQVQRGTVEDLQELDRILNRHRHSDTALAHILSRVAQDDVPLHVAADIDQIVWEQETFIVTRDFITATDHEEGWVPSDNPTFATEEEARATLAPWMRGHVVSRVSVATRLPDEPAHVEHMPARA